MSKYTFNIDEVDTPIVDISRFDPDPMVEVPVYRKGKRGHLYTLKMPYSQVIRMFELVRRQVVLRKDYFDKLRRLMDDPLSGHLVDAEDDNEK